MGRRYFCDYCDRTFQDNLHNRKKHLSGVQHQKSKKAWYDLFRDASEILAEEECKKLCRRFLQTGQCDFGPSCRFSHMTAEDLDALKAHVEERRLREEQSKQIPPCNVESWLEDRAKKESTRSDSASVSEHPIYHLPPGWPPLCELPPSLHPPTAADGDHQEDLEWG
ncbi:zinc finger matrin-type protein 5 isoform X2 [Bufo gargarizans]|uniref:zinc finger matrin-type protein 5 isoform X2 n=1 Tax=Bufo gargarizans TaxID=30331 RepID=UPI001CF4A132|nr:zinc finger matrin-type protein 5 isoform X2 [Bufo gargarizans]